MNIAEKRLRDYPNYEKEIKYRKWDLEHSEYDVNAGIRAQFKNTNPQESLILKWEKDAYIKNRLFWKKCVEETLDELDETQRKIVEQYYFENVYGYKDLAVIHHVGVGTAWRACEKAKNILMVKLGEKLEN
ncbi:hypothetical protein JDW15_06150 [Aerococcaceae bacterium zg-ZJ1578]|uniref:hypothetical protein n=1 Tax=Aerococcaceae bacterium zg-252 TaxID=2796928 RepID=UPI001A2090E8|nr:hypothetical protein [Aerococcaceae bacterium zg-1578]